MKKAFLLLLLFSSFFADAQSLKEALFSGKLKNEPGSVIRKGDDLTTKIDTTSRKAPANDSTRIIAVIPVTDSVTGQASVQTQPPATSSSVTNDSAATSAEVIGTDDVTTAAAEPAAAPKDNNALWKEYMGTLTGTLKTEVLSSKKVKNGSYYVLVSYAIGTDGQTTITDVFVSPENNFLQQQIKERISLEAPKLNPVVNDAGVARKVNKKYNFTLVKE